MSQLKAFGDTAKSLARNPLGIIALFIVLIYGFASLVVGFSGKLASPERLVIVWFLVLFPVAVLAVFGWLVSRHHSKLYAPSDFRDESHFLQSQNPDLGRLPVAPQSSAPAEELVEEGADLDTPSGRAKHRDHLYGQHRGYFLVHSYELSSTEGQDFDIFIYLFRHKSEDYSDIAKTEFFLGRYWGNKIFQGKRIGKLIGIRTSAYGPFLCTCRVTFQDGEEVILDRYIDFEKVWTATS